MLSHTVDHSHSHQTFRLWPLPPHCPLLSSQVPTSHNISSGFISGQTHSVCPYTCAFFWDNYPQMCEWLAHSHYPAGDRHVPSVKTLMTTLWPLLFFNIELASFCVSPLPPAYCDPGASFHHSPHWMLRAQIVTE